MEFDFIRRKEEHASPFNDDVLSRISSNLDFFDVCSLLYLMCDSADGIRKIYEKFRGLGRRGEVDFSEMCRAHVGDWGLKIVESLVEIERFDLLLDVFGVNKVDAFFNVEATDRELNCNKIRMYKICDGLDSYHRHIFLKEMSNFLSIPDIPDSPLEVYFMYWNMLDLVNPDSGKGFDVLVKGLMATGLEGLVNVIVPEGSTSSVMFDDYGLESYPILDHKDVGLCVIVNQYEFDEADNNRASSCLDEASLEAAMRSLAFRVVVHRNLTSSEMGPALTRTVDSHFERTHSVLFVAVMSHGLDGRVMGRDGVYVTVRTLTESLHRSTRLWRVPKVVVICACRGDSAFTARPSELYAADGPGIDPKAIRSDIMDLVVCYSTIPGFISLRNTKKGSLFMQVLCEVLLKRPELEICEIFTIANRALMNPKDFRAFNPAKIAHPCEFNSRLLKKLYLKVPQ